MLSTTYKSPATITLQLVLVLGHFSFLEEANNVQIHCPHGQRLFDEDRHLVVRLAIAQPGP